MEKGENGKRRQNKSLYLAFLAQQSSAICRCIQNLKTLALTGPEKSEENFYWRERKIDKYRECYARGC